MSKHFFVRCDCCQEVVDQPFELSLVVGRSPCPAGGPSEDDYERFDLCVACTAGVVRHQRTGQAVSRGWDVDRGTHQGTRRSKSEKVTQNQGDLYG